MVCGTDREERAWLVGGGACGLVGLAVRPPLAERRPATVRKKKEFFLAKKRVGAEEQDLC